MPLRVAAYCRVSTDREDQAHSLHSQKQYFTEYIARQTDWTLAEIFADEGISGTGTGKREAFNRMIRSARAGELDLILTKEVSRFARNTVDALAYTRLLKSLGVGVLFLSDNIDTRESDGELRLTIMASIAQEESRRTSQRVKWGQKRRMEQGVVFGNNSIYGFDLRGGVLTVKEDEAAVVRMIYHKCLDEGKGTQVIARELYGEGIPPPCSETGRWSSAMVRRVLRNDKYVGDLLQKKFVTPDYLTHRKEPNRGLEEQVYLRDHHEAVVSRDIWERTQVELSRRAGERKHDSRHSGRYWCSGKIRCGACGGRFVLRKTVRPGGTTYRAWGCHNRVRYGKGAPGEPGCGMRMVNDRTLTACAAFVLHMLEIDYEGVAAELLRDLRTIRETGAGLPAPEDLVGKRMRLERKKRRILDAFFDGTITKKEMLRGKERCDREQKELEELAARQKQDEKPTAEATLLPVLRRSFGASEYVLGEVIEQVVVHEDCIEIRVHTLPLIFRLWYSAGGRGEKYRTEIERWDTVPVEK